MCKYGRSNSTQWGGCWVVVMLKIICWVFIFSTETKQKIFPLLIFLRSFCLDEGNFFSTNTTRIEIYITCIPQSTFIIKVPQCPSPRQNWDPHPLCRKWGWSSSGTKGGGGHTRLRVRGWGFQSRRLEIKPSTLSTLWCIPSQVKSRQYVFRVKNRTRYKTK